MQNRSANNRPAELIYLTKWTKAHRNWLLPQWRNVLFPDESRFGLVSDDYQERVWRERGGQNGLATAIGVAPYRGGTQMIYCLFLSIKFIRNRYTLIIEYQFLMMNSRSVIIVILLD
nr:unnamed protein product [Callosobruchus chinensis]